MLPDFERKMLRILYNFSHRHRRMPDMSELVIKTGRKSEEIKNAISRLEEENYITWDDKSSAQSITIIEGWERGTINSNKPQSSYSIDYWTQY